MKNSFNLLFRVIAFFSLYIMFIIIILSILKSTDGIKMQDNIDHLSFIGTISIDNDSYSFDISNLPSHNITHSLIATGHFSKKITERDSLIIWPRNLRLKLYVNNMLKISTGQREEYPSFIQYAGNSFRIFYVGAVSPSDSIRIEIEKAYDTCRIDTITSFFNNIYAGPKGDVYESILHQELFHPFVGFAIMTIGALVLLISLIQKLSQYQSMQKLYYIGFFCIFSGITYIYDSTYEYIDLFFPHPVFNTLVDLCCIPISLIFCLLFIYSSLQNKNNRRFILLVILLFSIVEAIPVVFQAFGILDLHVIQDYFIYLAEPLLLIGCLSLIYEIIVLKNSSLVKILFAVLPLLISLTLKLLNVLLNIGVERCYLRIGIVASCMIMLQCTFNYINYSIQLMEQEQRMKEELKQAHIAIMLSQIQPHFLYNALNTLQYICNKDGALAAEAIEHFSRYLRGNMDSLTQEHPIPFLQELKHIEHYVYIERLRFGDRVRVEYDLQVTDFSIPTLTLQPIIENAIRHGITKQAQGGVVLVRTWKKKDDIWITVSDNGVGFVPGEKLSSEKSHIGLDSVQKRLQLQCNGTIEVSSQKGIGTKVTIHLKRKEVMKYESHGS